MGVYLALDAGGTKTECAVANEERVLARVSGRTIKIMSVGAPEATLRLRTLLEEAGAAAGVPLYLMDRVCMGLAGISSEGVREWAEATLAEALPGAELVLTGDEEIALEAAFGSAGAGILVISGTGSHVVGRSSSGLRITAGGWGPMLGDEGSGHWIGVEAIRSGLRAIDRGVSTCLVREICGQWQVAGVPALVALANSQPRPDFAALARPVAECAQRGDALAQSVLERAGQELAAQVALVVERMLAAGCGEADIRCVGYTGSVVGSVGIVREAMIMTLRSVYPKIEVQLRAAEPLQGAIARARQPTG